MGKADRSYIKVRLAQLVAVIATAAAVVSAAQAQTANTTGANVNVLQLLSPFLALNSTAVGQQTLQTALQTTISANNSATLQLQRLAISDANILANTSNTITGLSGQSLTFGIAANLAGGLPAQAPVNGIIPIQPVGGLGALLGPIYQAGVCVVDNSGNCSTSKSPLPNSVTLLNVALNATFSDLDIAKCYFANGTVGSISGCGAPAVAPPGYSLPSFNGLPNTTNSVYDLAFGVTNQPPQVPYGNSRPFQVAPSQINQFASSNLSGLTADPAFPSGHTSYDYTGSLLLAIMVPEQYQSMLIRASEFAHNRLVLGAHYPTDLIGSRSLATYELAQYLSNPNYINNAAVTGTAVNLPSLLTQAMPELRTYLSSQCGGTIASCATSAANTANNPYVPSAANQATYQNRLTDGLPTLSFAQAPPEAAPAGAADASILLATVYGGSTPAALQIAPNGGIYGNLQTSTINQIIMNTETMALAAFYGTSLSYWSRLDLYSAAGYFQNVIGVLTLTPTDQVTTNVTVGNGGTFGGTGTVVGNTIVNSGGALAPGVSSAPGTVPGAPGTLTIQGNLQFKAGSAYQVQVAPGSASLTSVTGAATIASGSQVSANFAHDGGKLARRYTILSAAAGRSGAFDSIATVNLPAFLTASLAYTATDVQLNLTSGIGQISGLTWNQAAVAAALDYAFNSGAGSLLGLYGLAPSRIPAALDMLSGEGVSGTQETALAAAGMFTSIMMDQGAFWRNRETIDVNGVTFAGEPLAYAAEKKSKTSEHPAFNAMLTKEPPMVSQSRWRAWLTGFDGTTKLDGEAGIGSATLSHNTGGVAGGLDYQFAPDLLAGFALGGSSSNFSVRDRITSGNLEGAHFGGYAVKTWREIYVAGALSFSTFRNSETRSIVGIGPTQAASGSFGSNLLSGRVEAGWKQSFNWFSVTPFAALQVSQLWQNAFTETNPVPAGATDPLGLSYGSRSVTSLPTFLGAQFDTRFAVWNGMALSPYARLSWVHEFKPNREIDASLIALPAAAFTVDGPRAAKDAARIDAGAKLAINPNAWLFASFDGEFSSRSQSYAGKGGAKVTW